MKTHLSSTFGNNLADKSQQFQLETQYGHTIQLLINQQTQQPIIVLKNKRGQIISQAELDIQLNTKRLQSVEIEQVAYDNETKKLIFIFADESTAQTSIQALWDELEHTVISQLVLLKNILTGQHADLSNLAATYSQSLLNQVTASNERSTALVKEDLAQRAASIAETLALLADTQSKNHQGTLSTLNQNTSQLLNKLAALDRQLAATKTQEGQNAQSLTSALQTISAAIDLINELLATAVTERKELKDLIDGKSSEILNDTAAISQTASDIANKVGSATDTLDVETLFGKIAKLRSQLTKGQSDLDESLAGKLTDACDDLEVYLSAQILSPIQSDLQTAATSRIEALADLQARLTALSASVGATGDAENAASGVYKQLAVVAQQITTMAENTSATDALQRIEGKLPSLATTAQLEGAHTKLLNTIGDFSGLDQKTLVALLTAILVQVKEKSTKDLSDDLDTLLTNIQSTITAARDNTSDQLDTIEASIKNHTTTKSGELAGTIQNALNSAVATIQGGKQGQTKQTLSSLSGDLSNFDKRLEFIVTMLANKPTLKIVGNSISVPTYYLVGEETTIPIRAETSRTLKADELLKVSLKTVSGTLDGAEDSTSRKTPDDKNYTTTAADTENLIITTDLTKTNPYDPNEKFTIATASRTVYRAYKVYYGYADAAPSTVASLNELQVYSTHGTCTISENDSVGGKYLYIFVPKGFGETAGKLRVSSSGFTYNWRSTVSDIGGYYAYKSTNALNSHDKISLIQ